MYSSCAHASFDPIAPSQSCFNDLLLKLQHLRTQQSNLVPNDACEVWWDTQRKAKQSENYLRIQLAAFKGFLQEHIMNETCLKATIGWTQISPKHGKTHTLLGPTSHHANTVFLWQKHYWASTFYTLGSIHLTFLRENKRNSIRTTNAQQFSRTIQTINN